jgi:hypothetical protein
VRLLQTACIYAFAKLFDQDAVLAVPVDAYLPHHPDVRGRRFVGSATVRSGLRNHRLHFQHKPFWLEKSVPRPACGVYAYTNLSSWEN